MGWMITNVATLMITQIILDVGDQNDSICPLPNILNVRQRRRNLNENLKTI